MTPMRALVPTMWLAAFVGTAITASTAYAVDDPFARWTFDASNGNDVVGTLHLSQQGPVTYVNGRSGKVAKLDGATTWLDHTVDPAFAPGSDSWTMYAWILMRPGSGSGSVLSWYRCGANPGCSAPDGALYSLKVFSDGHPSANFRDDNTHDVTVTGSVSVADGRWHLLVGTLDQTLDRVRLYVDGAVAKESTTTVTSFTAGAVQIPLEIGRWFRTGWGVPDDYFKGSLDDVRLYRRALSATEVTSLYTAGVVGVGNGDGAVADGSVWLGPAAPNPVSRGRVTSVHVRLAHPGHMRLAVFDVAGRSVRVLLDESRDAGEWVATWDGLDGRGAAARPGVYFVRAELDGERAGRAAAVTIVR